MKTQTNPKKILFLSPYPFGKAPSQRLKYEQYYPYFEEAGFEVETSSFISEKFWEIYFKKRHFLKKIRFTLSGYLRRIKDVLRLKKFDVVYVHLWVVPFGPPVFEYWVARRAKILVYDIDDLIFLKPKSRANPFIRLLKSTANYFFLMKAADHVITCTPYLDKFVRNFNPSTTDISSTIHTGRYSPRADYSITGRKAVLGWSGSYTTSRYLYLLQDVLLELNRDFNFKLLVMGDENFSMDGIEVEAIPWKEEYEVNTIKSFDIGLYPLPDEEWVHGKSGLKALQYMAAGVPAVATAIGANFRVIENDVSGFLAFDKDQWVKALAALLSDEKLRKRIGRAGAKKVEREFSVEANKGKYLSILNAQSRKIN